MLHTVRIHLNSLSVISWDCFSNSTCCNLWYLFHSFGGLKLFEMYLHFCMTYVCFLSFEGFQPGPRSFYLLTELAG